VLFVHDFDGVSGGRLSFANLVTGIVTQRFYHFQITP
jgi:hypothetical protein